MTLPSLTSRNDCGDPAHHNRTLAAQIRPEGKKIAVFHQDGRIKEIFDHRLPPDKPISEFLSRLMFVSDINT